MFTTLSVYRVTRLRNVWPSSGFMCQFWAEQRMKVTLECNDVSDLKIAET